MCPGQLEDESPSSDATNSREVVLETSTTTNIVDSNTSGYTADSPMHTTDQHLGDQTSYSLDLIESSSDGENDNSDVDHEPQGDTDHEPQGDMESLDVTKVVYNPNGIHIEVDLSG
ncbi:hypothetical protein HAX54_009169 [Datura stramonium]|uniref:Uncharacterized protein n=1 Tax=Datura stramonium TaxID=4076 RepID=A0ABS8TEJ7_DATST|nr:hypothetical protein [Datura stramonium]